MEEQLMFTRIHDALDVPMPPGAYERLRTNLTKKPVRPFRWPALQTRWSMMSFRFAAGLVIVAIAVAAAAAAIAIHDNVSPAGSVMPTGEYQAMVRSDWVRANGALEPCQSTTPGGCAAKATHALTPVQLWLDDLNRAHTPRQFVNVDAEMRAHLAQEIGALRFAVTATREGNAAGVDGAFERVGYTHDWTTVIVDAIVVSRSATEAQYRNAVRSAKASFDNCFLCEAVVQMKTSDCSSLPVSSCFELFDAVAANVADIQAAVVANLAPASDAAADHRLQVDLTRADAELIAMKLDVANRDVLTFAAALTRLQAIVKQIDADAAQITG